MVTAYCNVSGLWQTASAAALILEHVNNVTVELHSGLAAHGVLH